MHESSTPTFDEKPLEGPLTALHIMKHTERHGGDPRQWLALWARSKRIDQSNRVDHEMKVITDALFFAATFDQVNIPALMSMECLCRRLQAITDAYTNPNRPSWENAKVCAGQGMLEDIVSPAFRTYATRRNKDELELLQASKFASFAILPRLQPVMMVRVRPRLQRNSRKVGEREAVAMDREWSRALSGKQGRGGWTGGGS